MKQELLNGSTMNTTEATLKFVFPTDNDSFPQLRYLGYGGIFFGVVQISTNNMFGIIIAVVSIILVKVFRPTKRILELNNNTVRPRSLFGSTPEHFNTIDALNIKSTPISQRLNSRGSTTEINYELFQAYLVSDGTSILLGEQRKKQPLLEKLNSISELTNATINDET